MQLSEPTFGPWRRGPHNARAVAVMMSGGVDSSVTALLLKRAGWDVVGITMKIPMAEGCGDRRSCCGVEAAYVCRDLEIAHYYVEVADEFNAEVIEPFRESYRTGMTPSPCVDCNTALKFGRVWDFIEEALSVDDVATGHYARVVRSGEDFFLRRATDAARDQSYFLYGIPVRRLRQLHFPLGELPKDAVRTIAREARLAVARRSDSMELCFAGEGDYRRVLGGDTAPRGRIMDIEGREIGRHSGIAHYTLGQRKGLGIAAPEPLYVIRIDPAANTLTVGTRSEAFQSDVEADALNVLVPDALRAGERLWGKVRSYGDATQCTIRACDAGRVAVCFDEPQFAPAPGQRLVLYDDDGNVVAGGTIANPKSNPLS